MANIEPRDFIKADYLKFDNTNGEITVKTKVLNSLINFIYDYISITYPTTTSEVYTYKTGGSSGTTVGTITVTYSDTSKENIISVART